MSIVLTLAMCLGLLPTATLAAEHELTDPLDISNPTTLPTATLDEDGYSVVYDEVNETIHLKLASIKVAELILPKAPMPKVVITTEEASEIGEIMPVDAYGGTTVTLTMTPEQWYTEAVHWAADCRVVEGYNGRFMPEAPITREQMVTILWRYA